MHRAGRAALLVSKLPTFWNVIVIYVSQEVVLPEVSFFEPLEGIA